VTISLRDRRVHAVLLDVEGTTTPLAFVHDVLFPYARSHLREYLREHAGTRDVREVGRLLREEWTADSLGVDGTPPWRDDSDHAMVESIASYAEWLMARDRKSPGLKLLQGWIWQRGYGDGTLHGDVFPDVPRAFDRWRHVGIDIAIYSSGSALAQRLLFSTTAYGDLTSRLSGFFDTSVGAKQSPDSYRRIVAKLRRAPASVLFVSDVSDELSAAREAGLQALLCARHGDPAPSPNADVPVIASFDEIVA